jgi:hypothetical protein
MQDRPTRGLGQTQPRTKDQEIDVWSLHTAVLQEGKDEGNRCAPFPGKQRWQTHLSQRLGDGAMGCMYVYTYGSG